MWTGKALCNGRWSSTYTSNMSKKKIHDPDKYITCSPKKNIRTLKITWIADVCSSIAA
jgi:hypothetical protein